VDVRFVTASGVDVHSPGDVPDLLAQGDGFVWVDVAEMDDVVERLLGETFGFHGMTLRTCRERNHVPATHVYADYLFVVLHAPETRTAGHVHLLELDQFVGRNFLVTVHGPVNPAVPLDSALVETRAVLSRMEEGRFRPATPADLSYAVVSAIARRQWAAVSAVAEKVAGLEQRVMVDDFRRPEALLEEMFLVRHELLTVRTMAAQSHEIYARLRSLAARNAVVESSRGVLEDLADQFERVRSLSDGEKEFLFGVIDLYQTRVATRMTVAVERLAVLAAVTLPITAVASVYGMNVIVNERTHVPQLLLVLALMVAMSATLLRWTKRQGWW
jgi:Mg2+ and Co2+ transporter CorA